MQKTLYLATFDVGYTHILRVFYAADEAESQQKRATFGATCVVQEQITLRRESRQGSLQDSPPTMLHVRAWLQASQSKAPGRGTRPFLRLHT
jgi:hypothetical protein